jgi:carbon-monoxide dehydrogenase iron sulfur subunit
MVKKIFCDIQICLGCRSCELACAVEHSKSKTLFEGIKEVPLPRSRKKVESVGNRSLAVACCHCELAPCVQACMAGSMYKDEEGKTIHNEEKCVGCGMCIMVCPFGVITRQKNIVLKCDLCPDLDNIYACVEACPTGALFVGTVEEFEERTNKRKLISKVF